MGLWYIKSTMDRAGLQLKTGTIGGENAER